MKARTKLCYLDTFVEASMIVPFDLAPSPEFAGDQPWTALRIDIDGEGVTGNLRRLSDAIAIDAPTGTCTEYIVSAGDIGTPDGGPAQTADMAGAPDTLLTLGPAGPVIDIIPGNPANEVEPGSNQVFFVALISSPGFDATKVKHSKVRFGAPGTTGQTPMGGKDMDLNEALETHGYSMSDLVKCTVMLADISEWAVFNDVYKSFFVNHYPARSAFGANGLALGALVEVECIAVRGK